MLDSVVLVQMGDIEGSEAVRAIVIFGTKREDKDERDF